MKLPVAWGPQDSIIKELRSFQTVIPNMVPLGATTTAEVCTGGGATAFFPETSPP